MGGKRRRLALTLESGYYTVPDPVGRLAAVSTSRGASWIVLCDDWSFLAQVLGLFRRVWCCLCVDVWGPPGLLGGRGKMAVRFIAWFAFFL